MTPEKATQVVLLTPQGRGAVATVLIEGPRAAELVAELFHPATGRSILDQPCGKILFGRWFSPEYGEELVVCRRDSQRIEIHCHGGQAAPRAIVASLIERGCSALEWNDWIRKTTVDPIAATAQIALAAAATERAAAILCDQLAGALRQAINQLSILIRDGNVPAASAKIDHLLDFSDLGLHLKQPWQICFAGRTNVGKSSLINALLGYERAIVHATAGTTRDVVTAGAAIDGWPVELADTAGQRASSDELETEGIGLGQRQLAKADLVVLVFDLSVAWSDEDDALATAWPGALHVFNKRDLTNSVAFDNSVHLTTSALAAEGLGDLERAISKRLVPRVPAAGQAIPFTIRQVETLHEIRRDLQSGEAAAASKLLERPTSWADADC